MEMSTWTIVSWVAVAIMTGINIFAFIKLKNASEQMMKMAFPSANNMSEALEQMQGMMKQVNRGGRGGKYNPTRMGMPGGAGMPGARPNVNDAQLKQAMDMLNNLKGKK